jgi:hypothetical protein
MNNDFQPIGIAKQADIDGNEAPQQRCQNSANQTPGIQHSAISLCFRPISGLPRYGDNTQRGDQLYTRLQHGGHKFVDAGKGRTFCRRLPD